MCSRYSLTSPVQAVRSYFGASGAVEFPPRYNIAPTQPVLIVRNDHKAQPELALARWGLIPSWMKDPAGFATLINARSETAAEKPSFRGPLRHRRCLVPTDGFYEWSGPAGAKRPYRISLNTDSGSKLMGLAGLWEHWLEADGSEVETMAILTVQANTTVGAIHDRMPVILAPADFALWLDCKPGTAEHIQHLLRPAADNLLGLHPVSTRLNNVRNEGAALLENNHPSIGDKLI